jgi:LuxR family maltose regulon positive regulatory protein
VDDADSDPAVLLAYLAKALLWDEPGPGLLAGPLDDAAYVSAVTLPRLGTVLANKAMPFVLVLDDTHRLRGPAWEVVSTLVGSVPDGSQVVLAGQVEPGLALGQLRTQGRFVELRSEDLAMTAAEVQSLAGTVGIDLDPAAAATATKLTEGWAASLYLEMLSIRDEPNVSAAVAETVGDDWLVLEYIRDEIFAGSSAEDLEFLTRSSILPTMSGSLCDAVLRTQGSAAVLERLSRVNLLVRHTGRESSSYSYHPTFAEALRAELRRVEPGLVAELHRRAGDWYEQHDAPEEAMRQAHAAGDLDRAAQLLWSHLPGYLAAGRVLTLERWLATFEEEQRVRDPLLALTSATCALLRGRPVQPWLTAAQIAVDHAPGLEKYQSLNSVITVWWALVAKGGSRKMAANAEQVIRQEPPSSPTRATAHYLAGAANYMAGDAAKARTWLEEGERIGHEFSRPSSQALCLAQLALMAHDEGDWDAAEEAALHADSVVEQAGIAHLATMAPVLAAVALVFAHRGQKDDAVRTARQALRGLAVIAPTATWVDVQMRIVLGRVHLLLGDAAAARVLLAEAQLAVGSLSDASVLHQQLADAWTLAQASPLTTRLGPSSVTGAELRVLQLLPTHLSFQEISETLMLTRNTVKTQAISAYRKLGVNSRSEAVDEARSLGLIAH